MTDEWDSPDFATFRSRPLEELWSWLMTGLVQVAHTYETNEHHALELRRRIPSEAPPARLRSLLERGLTTHSIQALAIESQTPASTMMADLKAGLAHLGVERPLGQVPVLLILAARKGTGLVTTAGQCQIQRVGAVLVATIPRVDQELRGKMAPSELSLVRALVDGSSFSEIARQRGVSKRTVANLLAALLRRFGFSGRRALVNRLCEGWEPG